MTADAQPAETPSTVPVQPVPIALNVGSAMVGEEPAIVLEISSPMGFQVYFLNRDTALEVSSMLKKAAQTGPSLAKPGLLVPR